MLKFGTDIEIPYEILEALQNDKLVIFCGAGISYYDGKGLPLFPDLVRKAYAHFNRPLPEWDKDNNAYKYEVKNKSPAEASFERGFYDKTLEYLENSLPDPTYFRKWLLKQFICDEKESPDLRFHKALLKLAQLKGGKKGHRIITTNVDNYFDIAAKELGYEFSPLNQSPLPLPDRERWQSLTYLHGCAIQANQSTGQNLVFTSSDFSKAYLLDGWASRFIAEIFRQYTVLFIGYGVEDPLVTYLMDGLNSNSQISRCFAFADYKGEDDVFECHDRWMHKNITPILFNARKNGSGYTDLLTTVENWSNEFSQSAENKAKTVTEIISKEFNPREEVCINNYRKFILYTSQNIQANKFTKTQQAFIDTPGHISWLQAFDTPIDLSPDHDPSVNIRLTAVKTLSPLNPQSLRSHVNQDSPRLDETPIAGPKPTAELSNLSRMIFIWLCRHHLDKIELVKWVAEKRGQLHDNFKDFISYQLTDKSDWQDKLAQDFRSFWETLVNLPLSNQDQKRVNYFYSRIDCSSLLHALKPSLMLESKYLWGEKVSDTPSDHVCFKIRLADEGFATNVLTDFQDDNTKKDISKLKENLNLYARDFTDLIRQAWRLTNDLPVELRAFEFPRELDYQYTRSGLDLLVVWAYYACLQLYEKVPEEACAIWLEWIDCSQTQEDYFYNTLIFEFIKFDAKHLKLCPIDKILSLSPAPYQTGIHTLLHHRANEFAPQQISTFLENIKDFGDQNIYYKDRVLATLFEAKPSASLSPDQIKRAQSFLKDNELFDDDQKRLREPTASWVPKTNAQMACSPSAPMRPNI